MITALTPAQIENVISLLEQLSEARKAGAAEGRTDEIMYDPERRNLTDFLYSLSDEARGELITLMLLGRGDFDYSSERAIETRSKYTNADDQVAYLISKTVRLAEYLRIGWAAIQRSP
jgi:hypothetical protein